MSDLRDLYQEVILDHNKRPRNFRILPQPTHHADGVNPLCGDRISVFLDIEDGIIRDIAFQGAGCAISSASAFAAAALRAMVVTISVVRPSWRNSCRTWESSLMTTGLGCSMGRTLLIFDGYIVIKKNQHWSNFRSDCL